MRGREGITQAPESQVEDSLRVVKPQRVPAATKEDSRGAAKHRRINDVLLGLQNAIPLSAIPRREYGKTRDQSHIRKWQQQFQTNRGRQLAEHLSAGHLRRNSYDRGAA